ncbi:SbmA/BacA-like family transporter [Serratia ureilytica]
MSEERWRAWMMLIAIVVLSLGLVYISVQINQWNQVFYDALQNKNYPVFKAQLWRFTYLALIFIVLAVYKIYLTQGLQMLAALDDGKVHGKMAGAPGVLPHRAAADRR